MQETICEIELDAIRVSPFQPRRHFSEEELQELAASIQAVGLIHPPVVRKIVAGDKLLYYELIAGERRWRAAKLANLKTIPVIVRISSDDHAAKATLIENVQRVNLDPIELAQAFKKLIEVFRMTQDQVAEKVGKKRSTVANYLRLLQLPESIRVALSKGEITMGHAKALLSLNTTNEQEELAFEIIKKGLTVRHAEKKSQKILKKRKKIYPKGKDIHALEVEEKLKHLLGTKIVLEPQKEGGKLIIFYSNLDELDRLLLNFEKI